MGRDFIGLQPKRGPFSEGQKYGGRAVPRLVDTPPPNALQNVLTYGDVVQGERVVDLQLDEPGWFTVAVQPVAPITPVGGTPAAPLIAPQTPFDEAAVVARVTWGMGGGGPGLTADIDVCGGCCIPLYGSRVTVDVLPIEVQAGVQTSVVRPPMLVASVSPGAKPRTFPLRRAVLMGNILAAGQGFVQIPPFARQFQVIWGNPGQANHTIAVCSQANNTVLAQWVMDAGVGVHRTRKGTPLPLPGVGGRVAVTNNEAAATMTNVRVVFDLDI
jgi:hypothetical protein